MDTAGGGGGGRAAAGGADGGLASDERPGGTRLDFASNGQSVGGAEGEASLYHEMPLFQLIGKSGDKMRCMVQLGTFRLQVTQRG